MASVFAPAPSIAPLRLPRGWGRRASGAVEAWLEVERDQLALWLPAGLALGIGMWFWLPDAEGWLAFLLSMAVVSLLSLPGWARSRTARLTGGVALAAILGCGLVWVRAERVAAPRLEKPLVATFAAKVLRIEPQPAKGSQRVRLAPIGTAVIERPQSPVAPANAGAYRPTYRSPDLRPQSWIPVSAGATGGGQSEQVKLPPYLRVNVADQDAPPGLATGAIVRLRARLLPPAPAMVPGGYDFSRVAWFDQLGGSGKALPGVVVTGPAHPSGWRDWLAEARTRLSRHIEARLPGGVGGFATALVTGDTGALPQTDSDALRRSGLAHLLSVSGLHVTVVIAFAMLVTMRLLALSPRLALAWPLPLIAAGFGALAGVGYTLLSGAEVPTIRSCIASLLVLGGLALGREAMTLRLVGAGAGLLMLLWPEALAGPSFQLSFAAVISIVALHEAPRVRAFFRKRDEGWAIRAGREAASLLLTGAVVELALLPIGLYHFHRTGFYGAIANLAAIPLTTFVIMPLEALALVLDIVGLGLPFWWLTGRATALLLWIAHGVGWAPGAIAFLPTMPAAAYGLTCVGGLWLALWRTSPRWLGLLPVYVGLAWTFAIPAPDLIVTADGRHLAVRGEGGLLAVLRDRAGDYVVDTLSEAAGVDGDRAFQLDHLPGARCSPDACTVAIDRGGRHWRVLAFRSAERIDLPVLARSCAAADIVIADRRLPRVCRARWLTVTPTMLARTGGVAITLADRSVQSVRTPGDEHPWSRAAATEPSRWSVMLRSGSRARTARPNMI